jgi:di/tripeptidase
VSGWTPNPDSAALKCLQQAYQSAFKIEPNLKVIHAGLECGIIAEHYPIYRWCLLAQIFRVHMRRVRGLR